MPPSSPPPSPRPKRTYTLYHPHLSADPLPLPSLSDDASLDLSVIVPAYNEEQRLPSMLKETFSYLSQRPARSSSAPFTFEVIVVDDGSTDNTPALVRHIAATAPYPSLRLLCQSPNGGKGAAVRAGMNIARGRHLLMADADAATDFSDLHHLEEAVAAGAHVAVGSRKLKADNAHRSPFRALLSAVFHLLVVLVAGVSDVLDTQCGFKLFTRPAARVAFQGQQLDRWAFDVENLYRVQRAGLLIAEVPVTWTEVPGSKISVVKATINMAFDMLRMRFYYVTGRWKLSTST